ncbi:hypothetical protein [Pantanalinema sp. GBBB05]|uniref:hypothetical protein n=1 Tax=Pantanalinema sp. GBBB05 TaxID=2604139 RepID=UPI001D494750|nr:hypothetical protein [Pantanalinema sp. GBBB05]
MTNLVLTGGLSLDAAYLVSRSHITYLSRCGKYAPRQKWKQPRNGMDIPVKTYCNESGDG